MFFYFLLIYLYLYFCKLYVYMHVLECDLWHSSGSSAPVAGCSSWPVLCVYEGASWAPSRRRCCCAPERLTCETHTNTNTGNNSRPQSARHFLQHYTSRSKLQENQYPGYQSQTFIHMSIIEKNSALSVKYFNFVIRSAFWFKQMHLYSNAAELQPFKYIHKKYIIVVIESDLIYTTRITWNK